MKCYCCGEISEIEEGECVFCGTNLARPIPSPKKEAKVIAKPKNLVKKKAEK
jgi:hypothetical protein